jgi:hypothetical protein
VPFGGLRGEVGQRQGGGQGGSDTGEVWPEGLGLHFRECCSTIACVRSNEPFWATEHCAKVQTSTGTLDGRVRKLSRACYGRRLARIDRC